MSSCVQALDRCRRPRGPSASRSRSTPTPRPSRADYVARGFEMVTLGTRPRLPRRRRRARAVGRLRRGGDRRRPRRLTRASTAGTIVCPPPRSRQNNPSRSRGRAGLTACHAVTETWSPTAPASEAVLGGPAPRQKELSMSFRLKALLAGGALAFSSGVALAQTAVATTDANVRSGPGGQYRGDRPVAGRRDRPHRRLRRVVVRDQHGPRRFRLRPPLAARRQRRAALARDRDRAGRERGDRGDDPDAITGLAIGGYWEQPAVLCPRRLLLLGRTLVSCAGRARRAGASGRGGAGPTGAAPARRAAASPTGRRRVDAPRYDNRPPRHERRRDEGGRRGGDRSRRTDRGRSRPDAVIERGGADRGRIEWRARRYGDDRGRTRLRAATERTAAARTGCSDAWSGGRSRRGADRR